MGYLITKTANEVENFKYRYSDGMFYYCDEVKSNYTQMYDDGMIVFFDLPAINDYGDYIKNLVKFKKNSKRIKDN